MKLTKQQVLQDIADLPRGYKTADIDRLIRGYVKEKADGALLRPYVLSHQELHRIYFYVALKQLPMVEDRMRFIHENLLFSDWWHTDELIGFVADLNFEVAMEYGKSYVLSEEPYVKTAALGAKVKGNDYRSMDIGIAAAYLTAEAATQGLGTCILGWFDDEKIRSICALERPVRLVITLGYAAQGDPLRPKKRKAQEELVTFKDKI